MAGSRGVTVAAVGLWLLAVVSPAIGQDQPTTPGQPPPTLPPPVTPAPEEEAPPPVAPTERPPVTTPEEPVPTPTPGVSAPPTFLGPDLFNPPPHRGWVTFTPSISIVGEYNDNVYLLEEETDDIIVSAVPGFTLSMQRPNYRLLGGYNFTADYYVEESENNGVGKSQQLFADALFRFGPSVTFSLLERFIYDRESSVVTSGGVSVGRQASMRNTLAPRLDWQATRRTSLNFFGSYTLLRFDGDEGSDSDTYRAGMGADYSFTPRLAGTGALGVGYFDIEDEEPATTYTPSLGLVYQFTPTLSGTLSGGPTVFVRDGETHLTPAINATLLRTFRTGSLSAGYNRAVTAETIGSSDRQTAFAVLRLPALARGVVIELSPRYTRVDEDIEDAAGGDDRAIDVISVNLRVTYQIARTISVFGAYTYHYEREDPGSVDLDQNRIFFGLQYAYPINFN